MFAIIRRLLAHAHATDDTWRIARHTHMAIMSPSKKTVVKPPKGVREQRLMDNISALSEGDDEKRIVAATDIVKFLLSKQNQVSINSSDNMSCDVTLAACFIEYPAIHTNYS